MEAVVSVPANEGISVKNENDDPEINAMALKMKENYQKNATSLRQQGTPPANVYINRAGRPVPLNSAILSPNVLPKVNQEKSKDAEDIESIRGRFGWITIGAHHVPFIIRVINSEYLKFVSVRVAETQLLSNYLHYLHADIYTCTSVKSHFITESEAKLLNDINLRFCDQMYGKEPFISGKDCIVRLEDVHEFYTFIEVCYKRLLSNFTPGRKEKCGFIRINSESVVPYCIKDDKKYVPLFYFEGETENLRHQAIKLENWNLAYLKFCCKVQGIRNELFASDSCIVTSLDDIKSYFPPDTNFEEYWPAKVVDQQLLTNQKSSHVNPPGSWIKTPCTVLNKASVPDNIVQHPPLPPPQSAVPPLNMPMGISSYQNGWPSNQMVNSYITQAQPPPPPPPTRGYSAPSRNQNIAAQYYNANSAVPQQSNNTNPMTIQPPPLVRTGIPTTQIVSNNPVSSYPNVATMSPSMTTMYNSMPNGGNVMSSHASQMRQFYGGQRSASSGQMQQHQQHSLQQQLQHQMLASAQAHQQQQYGGGAPSMTNGGGVVGSNARITNTQQRNALRPPVTAPASEIIDLSSPPSSPGPSSVPQADATGHSGASWDLKKIAERQWMSDSPHNAAYKIQKATLQGKMIHCINAKAFIYSDLMVTLDDLVQALFPTSTVARCAEVLTKYLNTTLYRGNSEQIAVLRENGRIRSDYADDTPMVMLQEITHVLLQLKALMTKHDEQVQQFHLPVGGPAKRQRTS